METTPEEVSACMHRVQQAERDLRELGTVWRTIEAAAAISCPEEVAPILPTLVSTRERFESLQQRLIGDMAAESMAALGDELTAKARCAIDILVRNLFERTADVGFLATDEVVRRFCALPATQREAEREAMVARLREYQAKYTVYDDVILLDPQGVVLARLDPDEGLARSADRLVAGALAAGGYVEQHGLTDLQRGGQAALLYGHRITGATGTPIGVLVLRFRFDDEMAHVFDGVADVRREMALVLLDGQQRVVATMDGAHVPVGARLGRVEPGGLALTSFAGREYLAVCCDARGYQGYAGPGWRAQAMVSLLTAFRDRDPQAGAADHEVPLEHAALQAINHDADAIDSDLRRVVWNGRLMASGQHGDRLRLKAVLGQVNTASVRTRQRVGQAIQDLTRTAFSRSRRRCGDLARLAADIMDRNLYERANDCRWWALSPAMQQGLQIQGPQAAASLNRVLDHINGLYTVYSRLVVFDAGGVIRGASCDDEAASIIDTAVDPRWLHAVRGLTGSQHYAVSDFEDTPLHAGGPTYTYLAAVRHQSGGGLAGGVAIVFHAAREFEAMLHDVLGPRTGLAAFIDGTGRVLAATDTALARRAPLAFDNATAMFELDGVHYVAAQAPAAGYREFKRGDGYDNHVRAVVALRLGTASSAPPADRLDIEGSPRRTAGHQPLEVALVRIGSLCAGLPAASVMEAVSPAGLVPLPGRPGGALGLLEVPWGGSSSLVHVSCARRLFGLQAPAGDPAGVVVVLRDPRQPERPGLGLRVDDVLSITEFDARSLHPAPAGSASRAPWLAGLFDLQTGSSATLVQLIDPARLMPGAAAEIETPALFATA
ncbi:chemotaxis protein CheW [Ideonella sp. YS5]|uniref:chemotaxis protein CheW n=1 Tax=Ideonella sp. YS5 TaxID=3453714 RepID=UPI003EE9CBA6